MHEQAVYNSYKCFQNYVSQLKMMTELVTQWFILTNFHWCFGTETNGSTISCKTVKITLKRNHYGITDEPNGHPALLPMHHKQHFGIYSYDIKRANHLHESCRSDKTEKVMSNLIQCYGSSKLPWYCIPRIITRYYGNKQYFLDILQYCRNLFVENSQVQGKIIHGNCNKSSKNNALMII